jgi:hypothetical protein
MLDLSNREVVGVDPGERETGLVRREGRTLHAHTVVTNPSPATSGMKTAVISPAYVATVLTTIDEMVLGAFARTGKQPVVAVESLTAPHGKTGLVSVRPLISTGVLLGAILAHLGHHRPIIADIVLVPPGGHGSLPLAAYPRELVASREALGGMLRVGGGKLRHARSAWDIAGSCHHPALTATACRYAVGSEPNT